MGVVALVAVIILMLTVVGGGGDGGARDAAQAFVTAVNDQQQPQADIFCEAFDVHGESIIPDLGGLTPLGMPEVQLRATLGDVTENGDTGTAVVDFEVSAAGQVISGDYHLDLKKEGGDWKICGVRVGEIDIPGLGG